MEVKVVREKIAQLAAEFALAPTDKRLTKYGELRAAIAKHTNPSNNVLFEEREIEKEHGPFDYDNSATQLLAQLQELERELEETSKKYAHSTFLTTRTTNLVTILEILSSIVTNFIRENWEV